MKDNNLDNFIANGRTKKKDNPITESKPKKPKYQSIRIHPQDYEIFRTIAFNEKKNMVDVISESAEILKEKYKL